MSSDGRNSERFKSRPNLLPSPPMCKISHFTQTAPRGRRASSPSPPEKGAPHTVNCKVCVRTRARSYDIKLLDGTNAHRVRSLLESPLCECGVCGSWDEGPVGLISHGRIISLHPHIRKKKGSNKYTRTYTSDVCVCTHKGPHAVRVVAAV